MYSISVTGFSPETPRKALEAALCKMAGLLEKRAVLEIFPPHLDRTDKGDFCAELLAGVSLSGGESDRAHKVLDLKKEISFNEHIRLLDGAAVSDRRRAIRKQLAHLREIGSGAMSSSPWMSFDSEQARDLQEHIQHDFSHAGNYIIIPNNPTPHRVWPELTDG